MLPLSWKKGLWDSPSLSRIQSREPGAQCSWFWKEVELGFRNASWLSQETLTQRLLLLPYLNEGMKAKTGAKVRVVTVSMSPVNEACDSVPVSEDMMKLVNAQPASLFLTELDLILHKLALFKKPVVFSVCY